MSYKIIMDSCGELHPEQRKNPRFESVPLHLEVGDWSIMDDENFDQAVFLKKVAESTVCPKSACPSPEVYRRCCEAEVDHIYIITLSARLSGSHSSALIGREMYLEENPGTEKKILVVDSRSASVGQTQILLLIEELEEQGLSFEEIAARVEAYRNGMNTFFVLDNLDTLRKNGRLTGVKSLVASTINIKPVMKATEWGEIEQSGQAIGIKKALGKLAACTVENTVNLPEKRLLISHCNNRTRAEYVRDLILQKCSAREVDIYDTAGVASMYANDGGIIIAV